MEESGEEPLEDEFELRSVCLPFLDELASAQSPPLEDKSLRINYETFQHLREESQHPFFQRLMTIHTFLKFSETSMGVSQQKICSVICTMRTSNVSRCWICLLCAHIGPE